jgi:thiosulfate/3-mercaptopyruvate sulfurtransferase
MTLVSTEWLNNNLGNVRIFDSSWHMPASKRNAKSEYSDKHIPGALFFDIDEHSNKDSSLPHMLPNSDYWTRMLWSFGIENKDHIIVYDFSNILSACRLWFSLKYFGHTKVSVLDGGMEKWLKENRQITSRLEHFKSNNNYKVSKNNNCVKNKKQIDENINKKEFKLIDARSKNRFLGLAPEPRSNVKTGSIKDSVCLPFAECINSDKTFLNKKTLEEKFKSIGVKSNENVVFTCGSGITACVLALAYSLINDKYLPVIYDGSWSEYGRLK